VRILCAATPGRLSEQAGLQSLAVGKVSLGPVFGASWHSGREILPILRPRDVWASNNQLARSIRSRNNPSSTRPHLRTRRRS
jgi:hypothetical protein